MKTETKMLAVLGIVVALCSMLFVASPITAIAAEEDDYVLGIYGNANEDDTIDMRDLTYVKLIFFGKKPETELADAKYDGEINPLDFIQIKLIIVGKEKELTILQYLRAPPNVIEEAVTVPMPIERIVATAQYAVEAICACGERDKLVGVTEYAKERELEILTKDIPSVGDMDWDMEKILEREPDIVIDGAWCDCPYEEQLNAAGIPLVQADYNKAGKHAREIRVLGWLLDNKEMAEELINFEQEHIGFIKERVEDLTPEQKARVYFEWGMPGDYKTAGPGSMFHEVIIDCGGMYIFDDLPTDYFGEVEPEKVVEKNPQVLFKSVIDRLCHSGYGVTDTSEMEEWRNGIMSRPGSTTVDAVKDERVYLINMYAGSTHASVYRCYVAKCLYPGMFQDMDPVAIHMEWMEKFLGVEFKGIYAYPLPS